MLSNLLLQRILDEAADDEKKKKDQEEQEKETKEKETEEPEEEETKDDADGDSDNEDNPDGTEENPEESDGEAPEGEEPPAEDGEAPPEGEEGGAEGDGLGGEGEGGDDGGMGDFSMDGDDAEEDLGPAPDGLPEADDDGSADTEEEDPDGETNIQTNIVQLSKLDRALAKKTIGENLVSLRSTIAATLGVIDRNEAVLDPDVRELSIDKLNNLHGELESFILHRFPILNYEDSLTQYLIFTKKVNDAINYVKTDGIKNRKS
ncbi:MAG: hypothetical protein NC311_06775 [Muribaculaceae bacterium]|nr:hypothetical protein [Muribaculaceae bacterium]